MSHKSLKLLYISKKASFF